MWELCIILENLGYSNRNLWECTRLLLYITTQVNSKKKLNVKDLLKFEWDDDTKSDDETEISNDDIKRLKKKSLEYEKLLKTNQLSTGEQVSIKDFIK